MLELRKALAPSIALLGSGCALSGYDFGGYRLQPEPAASDAASEAPPAANDAAPEEAAVANDSPSEDAAAGTCVPLTCAELGAACGKVLDGCGGVLNCGGCETGACGEGGPNKCGEPCVKRTCDPTQGRCETIADGCGGMISCGNCTRDR
jgi:hypothetical protein